ncbi:hypothetical protein EYC84_011560 [Monilinia fructicola]|uniref:Uncharacterized protein n=1 Tax=Monilinia fructicola TaxID=38448 RepID=A0A5M9J7Y9_MONFR|nr:hypothetical protein EYC84_011560 [Monilinia fructicola]
MAESIDSDVELPRNLNDADFDGDCTELPPSNPDSEVTSMSYIRFKSRICHVFWPNRPHAHALTPPYCDDIMKLDAQLNALHAAIPPPFQFRPISTCIADPSALIIQRLNIADLLYKSRCVLHRKHLLDTPHSPSHEHSINAGLHASMQLLDLQQQAYDAAQPDGVLSHGSLLPLFAIHARFSYSPP